MKLLHTVIDDEYIVKDKAIPFKKREVVRGVVLNENNEIFLIHLVDDDIFGHRDYYELPGGGIEIGENKIEALLREMIEETGYECEVVCDLGQVTVFYNLLYRENIVYFYLLRAKKYVGQKLTDYEIKRFKSFDFYNIDKCIELYKLKGKQKLAKLIKNTELPIIELTKHILMNIK